MHYPDNDERRRIALMRHERELAERDRLDRITLWGCVAAMAAVIAFAYFFG